MDFIIDHLLEIGIGIAAIIAFFAVDSFWTTAVRMVGTVIDRSYTPSRTSSGVGYGMSSSGQMTPSVVVTSSPEEWNVIVKLIDGTIAAVETDAHHWSTMIEGQDVDIVEHRCKFTGWLSHYSFAP